MTLRHRSPFFDEMVTPEIAGATPAMTNGPRKVDILQPIQEVDSDNEDDGLEDYKAKQYPPIRTGGSFFALVTATRSATSSPVPAAVAVAPATGTTPAPTKP